MEGLTLVDMHKIIIEQTVRLANQERTIQNQKLYIKQLQKMLKESVKMVKADSEIIGKFVDKEKSGIKILQDGTLAV